MIAMGTTSYENFVSHNGLFPIGSSYLDKNLSLDTKPIQSGRRRHGTGVHNGGRELRGKKIYALAFWSAAVHRRFLTGDDPPVSFAPAFRNESTHQKTFSSRTTRRMRFMRAVRSAALIRNAFKIVSAISSTS